MKINAYACKTPTGLHPDKWVQAKNQSDTGMMGVRMICPKCGLSMTFDRSQANGMGASAAAPPQENE